MKILLVNPNRNEQMTVSLAKTAELLAEKDTKVDAVCGRFGVNTVEGAADAGYAALAAFEAVRDNLDAYDAFIIACYSDPGLSACRELTDKPVLGIAQSSMQAALALGNRFSIVSPLTRMKPLLMNLALSYGMREKIASVRTVDLNVLNAFVEKDRSNEAFAEAARLAAEEDGAEVICLGGALFAGRDRTISEMAGVPCVDGLSAALKLAEMYVKLGYRTGKTGLYLPLETKERTLKA